MRLPVDSPGEVYHLVTGQTMSDPDMGIWSYGYNAIGNLTSRTTNGVTRSYTYHQNKPHAVTSITNPSAGYTYDNNGNMTGRAGQTITPCRKRVQGQALGCREQAGQHQRRSRLRL